MKTQKECLQEKEGPQEQIRGSTIYRVIVQRRDSTAFDSVTLYGEDPDTGQDIFGKIGEAGVSIATLDDMNDLFAGFDLTSPSTSVSMTINEAANYPGAIYEHCSWAKIKV